MKNVMHVYFYFKICNNFMVFVVVVIKFRRLYAHEGGTEDLC